MTHTPLFTFSFLSFWESNPKIDLLSPSSHTLYIHSIPLMSPTVIFIGSLMSSFILSFVYHIRKGARIVWENAHWTVFGCFSIHSTSFVSSFTPYWIVALNIYVSSLSWLVNWMRKQMNGGRPSYNLKWRQRNESINEDGGEVKEHFIALVTVS